MLPIRPVPAGYGRFSDVHLDVTLSVWTPTVEKPCKPRCSQPAQGCLLERWSDSDCEPHQL